MEVDSPLHPALFQSISQLSSSLQEKLTLRQIIELANYVANMRDEIIMVLPTHVDPSETPIELTPVFYHYLAGASGMEYDDVVEVWKTLGSHIWPHCDSILNCPDPKVFKEYGHPHGLTGKSLYPPVNICTNTTCKRFQSGLMIGKVEQQNAVLFTLGQGAVPIHYVHKYCEACHINYHHNFSVHQGILTYYSELSDVLQIGEHQFAEVRLVNLWVTTMLVAWSSASNCARWYNEALAHPFTGVSEHPRWQFKLEVTAEQVYSGSTLLSLLKDCQGRREALVVPHMGEEKDRFQGAVRLRNDRVRTYGLGQHRHVCKKCTRILVDENRKVKAVVIDGVTIGHPCCAEHGCKIPLANNKDRFCPSHTNLNGICCIVGCEEAVVGLFRSCGQPEHISAMRDYTERGTARFQLKARLERAKVVQLRNSLPTGLDNGEGRSGEEGVPSDGEGEDEGPAPSAPRIRVKAGRKRTHNEQLFVAPCGIVIARETFYHAEAPATVIEMIEKVYIDPATRPNHIIFDNNCTIWKMVKERAPDGQIIDKNPFFSDIGLTVDIFHFKSKHIGLTVDIFHFKSKHNGNDLLCQTECNTSNFPELQIIGPNNEIQGWYFNSSIAEQTNAWIGGYISICREMHIDRYNFFLDEMIMRRNQMTLKWLTELKAEPWEERV